MPDRSSPSEGRSRPSDPKAEEPPLAETSIEIVTIAPGWRRLVRSPERLARRAALAALQADPEAPVGTITVLLADDRTLKQLNTDHREKAKPTNVLSFPGLGDHLGDIALSLETVRREARHEAKRPEAHTAHLVAHGTLHLLGHDHLTAGEARRMERAEARALHRLRLPNPWKGVAA